MRVVQESQSRVALGGEATIGLVLPTDIDARILFAEMWRQTYTFERQFSRFIAESELSRFNASAGLKTPVSPTFADLLKTACTVATKTDGLINPFVLPAIQRAGYVHSAVEQYANDPAPDYSNRSIVAANKLEVGEDWARIPYGTAVDVGGFAKGYLADQLGAYARAQRAVGYWINLSGDIATLGQTAQGEPMTIAIQNARAKATESYLVTCPVEQCGVATSGTLRRKLHETMLQGHHIIDPQTGKAAETDVLLATVCANSAIQADILASCAVILGSKRAPSLLSQQGADSWLIQCFDKQRERNVRHGKAIIKTKETAHA